VTVEVCGTPTLLDGGSFYADATPGQPCDVVARRHFGVFQWEDRVRITPEAGRDVEVQLQAPDVDGVVPLVWTEHPDGGLLVTADWTDHGLQGQRVVSVDGQPALDDGDAMHLQVAGDPGTLAAVELADGRVEEVERRVLTFDDWLLEQ
jgi:hypothetical protein